jgi:hypothetical protein
MIRYCCFLCTQEPVLIPSVFWPKFGSDEEWICQLLTECVNDKSPITQQETDYVLCWRKKAVAVSTKDDRISESERENSKRNPLTCLPSSHAHGGLPLSDHPRQLHYRLNPWGRESQRREMRVQTWL